VREPASMRRSPDRKIDIERKTVTQDEFGEEVELWDKLDFRRSGPRRQTSRFTTSSKCTSLAAKKAYASCAARRAG
jgi:hypothetical protein